MERARFGFKASRELPALFDLVAVSLWTAPTTSDLVPLFQAVVVSGWME